MKKIYKNIEVDFDQEQLLRRLRIKPDSHVKSEFLSLLEDIKKIIKPCGVITQKRIDSHAELSIEVSGLKLNSRLIGEKLFAADQIFPYLVTAGLEGEQFQRQLKNPLFEFWVDEIMGSVLHKCIQIIEKDLLDWMDLSSVNSMNPGSTMGWDIKEQSQLFQLLGDLPSKIDVKLTDQYLMVPIKSISGFFFVGQTPYHNCQYCERRKCIDRKADFIQNYFQQKQDENSFLLQ